MSAVRYADGPWVWTHLGNLPLHVRFEWWGLDDRRPAAWFSAESVA